MKRWRPKFLRGYVSSICDFATFVEREKLDIVFAAVFTTAEVLGPGQRALIERVFKTEVFDNYGLNDGGITAFECLHHCGMHIDFERGYLEVVDEKGETVFDRPGRILATSFLNKATPFLRYDTGDIGIVSSSPCSCGSPYPLLLAVLGRQTDLLRINGCSIGSPVLTVLMAGIDVVRYQFVQTAKDKVIVNIEKADGYTDESERFIRESLFSQVGDFDLKFCYEGVSFRTASGEKHKFIINEYAE
jgi:phenylacetate-CoA ligase